MITYDIARKDHEYLWGIYSAAYDMTGAYVDQGDLDKLLKNPSKKCARDCYQSQIEYWFSVGPEDATLIGWKTDSIVREIAERYGEEGSLDILIVDYWRSIG